VDRKECIGGIGLTGENKTCFERVETGAQIVKGCGDVALLALISLFYGELQQFHQIAAFPVECFPRVYTVAQPLEFAHGSLGGLPIVPELGIGGIRFQIAYLLSDFIRVKDASR